jgi:hypothetical protein
MAVGNQQLSRFAGIGGNGGPQAVLAGKSCQKIAYLAMIVDDENMRCRFNHYAYGRRAAAFKFRPALQPAHHAQDTCRAPVSPDAIAFEARASGLTLTFRSLNVSPAR